MDWALHILNWALFSALLFPLLIIALLGFGSYSNAIVNQPAFGSYSEIEIQKAMLMVFESKREVISDLVSGYLQFKKGDGFTKIMLRVNPALSVCVGRKQDLASSLIGLLLMFLLAYITCSVIVFSLFSSAFYQTKLAVNWFLIPVISFIASVATFGSEQVIAIVGWKITDRGSLFFEGGSKLLLSFVALFIIVVAVAFIVFLTAFSSISIASMQATDQLILIKIIACLLPTIILTQLYSLILILILYAIHRLR